MYERRSETETRIFEDHRDNLTIDIDSDLVRGRAAEMRSEHSESALLWNVFRTLQRIDPGLWLPRLVRSALPRAVRDGSVAPALDRAGLADVQFHWWQRWDVPPERHTWLHDAALSGCLRLDHYPAHCVPDKKAEIERRLQNELPFEDPVEIPLCIETRDCFLGIETVYKSNLRRHTAFDSQRDAILRLLDAGSTAASGRGKRFAALVLCTDPRMLNVETVRLVDRYRGQPQRLVEALPHRPDRAALERLAEAIGLLRWKDLGTLLLETKEQDRLGLFDVAALDELIKYLARKDVGFNFFRRLK